MARLLVGRCASYNDEKTSQAAGWWKTFRVCPPVKCAISYIIFNIMSDAIDGFPLDAPARSPLLPAAAPRESTSRVIAEALRAARVATV